MGFPKLVLETVIRDSVQETGQITKIFPAPSFQDFKLQNLEALEFLDSKISKV